MPDDAENQRLDHAIAEFTDRLVEQSKAGGLQNLPVTGDEELVRLQQTVLQLKQAVPDQPPTPSFVARLRLALVTEYRRIHRETSPDQQRDAGVDQRQTIWQRLVNGFRIEPSALSLRLAGLAVIMIIITLFFFPGISEGIPATAGISANRSWIALVLGALCVVVVIWLARQKK